MKKEFKSMTHKGTIMLETERLILRRFTIEDLEQIYINCWSDFEVWKWTSYKPIHCIEDVIDVAEQTQSMNWNIHINQHQHIR